LVAFGQVGFFVAPAAVAPNAARIDPARGFRRIFGARSAFRVGIALGKLASIAAAMAAVAWASLPELASLADAEVGPALAGLGHVALRSTAAGLAAALAFGVADFFYQRFQHERDLRMTRAELREDLRASEGDPHVRARVRRVQREMARRRMLEEVPKATVVVTNPTHYAVALRYERGAPDAKKRAPRVVAKGMDHAARRIREIAREARVPLREDPPLARALHARCAIGDEIPADLYRAVAAALAYVYRVRGELEAAR
jgi:flagellar biosynthetic protein FlhB